MALSIATGLAHLHMDIVGTKGDLRRIVLFIDDKMVSLFKFCYLPFSVAINGNLTLMAKVHGSLCVAYTSAFLLLSVAARGQ